MKKLLLVVMFLLGASSASAQQAAKPVTVTVTLTAEQADAVQKQLDKRNADRAADYAKQAADVKRRNLQREEDARPLKAVPVVEPLPVAPAVLTLTDWVMEHLPVDAAVAERKQEKACSPANRTKLATVLTAEQIAKLCGGSTSKETR